MAERTFEDFLAGAREAGFDLQECNPRESRRHGAFLAASGELPVPFWTGAENPLNRAAENEVIDYISRRSSTLSVRDVRDAGVPWSIEVVGKRNGAIQHVRILCDHDVSDVLNLPFETHREGKDGLGEVDGYGRHADIDFLAYVTMRSGLIRLVHRQRFEHFIERSLKDEGVRYPALMPRPIPYDLFNRSAYGVLVPLIDLDAAGVILDTWHLHIEE